MQSRRLLTLVLIAMDTFITLMLKVCLGLRLSQGCKGYKRQMVWTFLLGTDAAWCAHGSWMFSDCTFLKEDTPFVYSASAEVIAYRNMEHIKETWSHMRWLGDLLHKSASSKSKCLNPVLLPWSWVVKLIVFHCWLWWAVLQWSVTQIFSGIAFLSHWTWKSKQDGAGRVHLHCSHIHSSSTWC